MRRSKAHLGNCLLAALGAFLLSPRRVRVHRVTPILRTILRNRVPHWYWTKDGEHYHFTPIRRARQITFATPLLYRGVVERYDSAYYKNFPYHDGKIVR